MYARDYSAGANPGRQLPPGERVKAAVTALRMLADPTRLRLVRLLREAEMDVTGLTALLGVAPAGGVPASGKLRRLVAEVLHAAEHHLTGAPGHD